MKKEYVLSSPPNITTNCTRMNTALTLALSALALTFVLVIPSSAQLTLNNRRLLASPGTYSGDIFLPSEAVLKVRGGGVDVLSGVLRDGLGRRGSRLTAEGDGTIALTGANVYSGGTAVNSGMLQVGAGGAGGRLGRGGVSVKAGARLKYDIDGDFSISQRIDGGGSLEADARRGRRLSITGVIGGTTPLESVTLKSDGASSHGAGIYLQGDIRTSGRQSYAGYVFASGVRTLRGGSIYFENDVSGDGRATLNLHASGGDIMFGGHISYNGYASGTFVRQGNRFRYFLIKELNADAGGGRIILSGRGDKYIGVMGGRLTGHIYLANHVKMSPLERTLSSTLIFDGPVSGAPGKGLSGGEAARDPWNLFPVNPGQWTFTDRVSVPVHAGHARIVFNAARDIVADGVISGDGGLVKEGSGTLILTGANTYGGGTVIGGGVLQIVDGGASGSVGSGGVINNATLTLNRSDELTLSQVISGGGVLIQEGGGKTVLSADNDYGGGTVIRGGILQIGRGGTSGSIGSGGVINNATLTLHRSDELTLSQAISGGGVLIQEGGGKCVVSANNDYSGGTVIRGGVLQIGDGGASGSIGSGEVRNNATLTINRSDELTLSQAISGSGVLIKEGGGKTVLSANNDYGGVSEVVVGELSLGGSLRSSVTVRSGGVLSSSGGRGATSGRVDVESGGTIHGGREAGALTVGELVLQDGAALDAYASGASVSKIISTSAPRVGALTVRLKNAMSAGTYALIEGGGNGSVSAVVTGENLSALYCVRYAWENGVKMTANNNTSIREGVLSGGGLLADASSSGLSAALQPSERGVTYHLFKTSNGVVSEAGAKEGTGGVLIFENLGAGVYSAKGSKDGCLRPMSGTVVISVDARAVSKGWLAHSIPEAVKATLERDAPTGKSSHFLFKDLYPCFGGKVMGSCEDTCRYYAGFQLSCDGSDFNTAVRWAAQLSLSLKKPGFPAVKLSDSLKADLGAQTFESTTFFDQTLRCEDDYEFIIDHASAKGNVPPGAVRLVIRLFHAYHAQMDPSAAVGESNFHVASAGQSASLSWSCAAPGAEEYDLEWVFIDACDGFSGSREEAFAFLEPVRVTVKGMEYSRTLYYPSGNVYYRIRPVGRQKLNPSRRTEGAWTYKGPFASTNHDESRTWQWQTVFSEEGKHKKSMSYYDATGRLRQQSVNLSSEGATLTGETLYDFEGRKSVEVMPVPSLGNSLSHKSNL